MDCVFLLRFLHYAESFNYLIEKGSYNKAEKMNKKQGIQSSQRTCLICKIINFKDFQTLKAKTTGFCLAVGVQYGLHTYCCSPTKWCLHISFSAIFFLCPLFHQWNTFKSNLKVAWFMEGSLTFNCHKTNQKASRIK